MNSCRRPCCSNRLALGKRSTSSPISSPEMISELARSVIPVRTRTGMILPSRIAITQYSPPNWYCNVLGRAGAFGGASGFAEADGVVRGEREGPRRSDLGNRPRRHHRRAERIEVRAAGVARGEVLIDARRLGRTEGAVDQRRELIPRPFVFVCPLEKPHLALGVTNAAGS